MRTVVANTEVIRPVWIAMMVRRRTMLSLFSEHPKRIYECNILLCAFEC
jgi:hypothetical protein